MTTTAPAEIYGPWPMIPWHGSRPPHILVGR
jgi:hypothetical protein